MKYIPAKYQIAKSAICAHKALTIVTEYIGVGKCFKISCISWKVWFWGEKNEMTHPSIICIIITDA